MQGKGEEEVRKPGILGGSFAAKGGTMAGTTTCTSAIQSPSQNYS